MTYIFHTETRRHGGVLNKNNLNNRDNINILKIIHSVLSVFSCVPCSLFYISSVPPCLRVKNIFVSGVSFLFLCFLSPFFLSTACAQRGEFTLEIVDSETGRPVDCCVYVRNQKGIAQKAEKLPFLYDHFTAPGCATMNYPLGMYPLEIERGLEYLPMTGHFQLNRSAKDAKTEKLRRFTNLAERGWWSGDLYVLRPAREIETLMKAGDVHLVPLIGEEKTDPAKKNSEPVWFDEDRVFTTRNYVLRRPEFQLGLLNLSAENAKVSEIADEAEPSLQALYRLRKKDPEMIVDILDANSWDIPALIAMKIPDSFQLLGPCVTRDQLFPTDIDWRKFPALKIAPKVDVKKLTAGAAKTEKTPRDFTFLPGVSSVRYDGEKGRQRWTEDVYFHLLNTGHRLTPSAGSGSGLSPNAVGANRVYVHVDETEYRDRTPEKAGRVAEGAAAAYDWNAWWEAFRAGEVVVTNGPLLEPRVDGCYPGEELEYEDDTPVSLTIGLTLSTRTNIQYLEIIVNGETAKSIRFSDYAKTGRLPPLEITQSGWFLIRVVGDDPKTYRCAMTAPYYVRLGEKPFISRLSAEFFLNWEKERIRMLRNSGMEPEMLKRVMVYHDYALKYWTQKVKDATGE